MQRDNEHSRVMVDGRRTDDGSRCSLLIIHEVGGTLALYPHGRDEFGVRLTRAILAGPRSDRSRLYEWLALRRVDEGAIATSAGAYYKHSRPGHHLFTGRSLRPLDRGWIETGRAIGSRGRRSPRPWPHVP